MGRKWLTDIDFSKRILEIGPLANPNIKKSFGANIFYADIRTTDEVKDFYKNDTKVNANEIVSIDYVIRGTYSDTLKNVEKFDYVIATHVLEHIPGLISFFQDIAGILKTHRGGGGTYASRFQISGIVVIILGILHHLRNLMIFIHIKLIIYRLGFLIIV